MNTDFHVVSRSISTNFGIPTTFGSMKRLRRREIEVAQGFKPCNVKSYTLGRIAEDLSIADLRFLLIPIVSGPSGKMHTKNQRFCAFRLADASCSSSFKHEEEYCL